MMAAIVHIATKISYLEHILDGEPWEKEEESSYHWRFLKKWDFHWNV